MPRDACFFPHVSYFFFFLFTFLCIAELENYAAPLRDVLSSLPPPTSVILLDVIRYLYRASAQLYL